MTYAKIAAAILIISCCACHSQVNEKAQSLSNTLSAINDSVSQKGRAFGACIGDAIRDRDYTKLSQPRQKFEDFIDSCGRSVKHMEDVAGSDQMRRAELAVLGFEKTMVHNDLVLFEKLTPESHQSEINVLFQIGDKDGKKEADLIAKFTEIQQEYAKKNGF